jgi:flagellar basal-body rod protein FlgB
MIQNLVLGKSGIPLLKKFLDLSSFRHKLVSGNIANVSTPGFKSSDIDFHGELKKAAGENKEHLAGHLTHPAHIPLGRSRDGPPEIIVNKSKLTNGINNVDIDKEVAALAENQIYFSVGARLLAKKFTGLKSAIKSK